MGLIHSPRTAYSVLNGLFKRQIYLRQHPAHQQVLPSLDGMPKNTMTIGFGETNPHKYQARLGLFDIDYLGHMNNAAYLTHAELARWELTSYNGMLQTMLKQQVHFLVVGTTIRYRKEIRPMFGKFQIDTTMCGLDDRNLYMLHQFRTISSSSPSKESRIMAQMIVQGVAVQNGRTVINPATFLKENIGFDTKLIDNIMVSNMNKSNMNNATVDRSNNNNIIVELLDRYSALDGAMKKATAEDDKKFT